MSAAAADVADFAASLSLIFVLALAYGALHRRMPRAVSPRVVLGSLFGVVAFLEMQRPLQPFDGVLIDMRNVPIALAGAFLGRSGLAACLAISVTSRLVFGGAGAFAGVAGMLFAGGAGLLWQHLTRQSPRRHMGHMVALAGLMSTHITTGLFLPGYAMLWFFSEAAGPLFAINMVVVPIAALILERERVLLRETEALKDAAELHPETGLLPWARFRHEVASRMTAAPPGDIAGLAEIALNTTNVFDRLWRPMDTMTVLGAMRLRLEQSDIGTPCFGLSPRGTVVFPVSSDAAAQPNQTSAHIENTLSKDALHCPGGRQTRPGIQAQVHPAMTHQDMAEQLRQLSLNEQRPRTASTPGPSKRQTKPATPSVDGAQLDLLFDKAALLMSTRSV